MPLTLPANGHVIVQDFLRGHADVTAIVGTRVSDKVLARPCIRVVLVTGSRSVPHWLTEELLQVEAYAETIGQARQVIDTASAALATLEGSSARGVVNGVTFENGPRWIPDPDLTANGGPMPRFLIDVRVFVHP